MKPSKTTQLAGLLLVCACGAQSEHQPPAETRVTDPLLEQVTAMSRADSALAEALRARQVFVATARGYETSPAAAADSAFVRSNADGDFELALSRRNRVLAKLHTSNDDLALREGFLVTNGAAALPSIWTQSGDALEQLLLSQSGAGVELDWQLELEPPIVAARLERSGALLLTDNNDRGLLRVPVPYGVDGAGQRVDGALRFSVRHERKLMIDISFSVPSTSRPPLLVDPALAAVLWQQRDGDQPPARVKTALAYDPDLHAAVLYGGSDESPGSPPLDDTWAYDGEWKQLEPTHSGFPRESHAMAYSASPPSLLVFGGRDENGDVSGSTLRWQGGAWTEVATTGPPKRDEHAMTYVPGLSAGDVVLYGGSGSPSWLDDTWIWSGTAWAEKTNAGGDGGFGQSLVFDTARGRALLFGGARSTATHLSSLALFNGTRWLDTSDATAPTRAYAAMAFDSERKRAVLFGGEATDSSFLSQTWEWDSASAKWSQRQTNGSPPRLGFGTLAYDPERKRAVLFGGFTTDFFPFSETWEYRALGGSCETSDDCDGVACVDGACCRKSACGSCEACSSATGECEPLTNQTDPDSCDGDRSCDGQGVCKQASTAQCKTDAECSTGVCADGVCCDRACDGACEACDSEGAIGTCSFVSGAARHGSCKGPPCGGECTGDAADCAVADEGAACGSSCKDSVVTASACDGKGGCARAEPADCPRSLACASDGTCLDECAADEDCRRGLTCRDAACVPPAVYCSGRSTLHELDGDERSCAPFACSSSNCLEACASAAQCADGLVCDGSGHCITPPDTADDTSQGCGCRVAGGRERWPVSASLLLLFVGSRRRRQAQKRALAPSCGTSAKKAPPVK